MEDTNFMTKLCTEHLSIQNYNITNAIRLGPKRNDPNEKRPLRVTMSNAEAKKEVIKKGVELRTKNDVILKNIFISPDQTLAQRETAKKLRLDRAKKQEELEQSGEVEYQWIIRNEQLHKVRKRME